MTHLRPWVSLTGVIHATIALAAMAGTAPLATIVRSQAVEKEVTFGFSESKLDNADQAVLIALVQQAKSRHGAVFELVGPLAVGADDYDSALSRRRVDSVARYLIRHGIPARNIRQADDQMVDPDVRSGRIVLVPRRVLVRMYAADPDAGGK